MKINTGQLCCSHSCTLESFNQKLVHEAVYNTRSRNYCQHFFFFPKHLNYQTIWLMAILFCFLFMQVMISSINLICNSISVIIIGFWGERGVNTLNWLKKNHTCRSDTPAVINECNNCNFHTKINIGDRALIQQMTPLPKHTS